MVVEYFSNYCLLKKFFIAYLTLYINILIHKPTFSKLNHLEFINEFN